MALRLLSQSAIKRSLGRQFVSHRPWTFSSSSSTLAGPTSAPTTPPTTAPTLTNVATNATTIPKKTEKPATDPKDEEQGYAFGTNHWTLERASAVALIPLITTQITYGSHPVCDGLLGVVLPYHIYMGLDSCVVDYIPKRDQPRLHKLSMWSLRATTFLVMWSCYEFNTNDIGLTEAIQRIWTA